MEYVAVSGEAGPSMEYAAASGAPSGASDSIYVSLSGGTRDASSSVPVDAVGGAASLYWGAE